MARRRRPYRMEEFRGENNRDSLTNQRIYGGNKAKLYRMRNYHLIGYGRGRKRYGYTGYVTPKIDGSNAVQGLQMYEFGALRKLCGISNGKLKSFTEGSDVWANHTGSLVLDATDATQHRFGNFTDGTTEYMLGTDGVNPPYAWDGVNNAVTWASLGPGAPTIATDVKEYHGYMLSLYKHSITYSAYGRFDWTDQNVIDATRDSNGLALEQHSKDAVLAFYERQVYRIMFNEREGPTFLSFPVEGSEPCISKQSIATKDGWTYYATRRGIRRIGLRGESWRDEFIGREIEQYWDSLNRGRLDKIVAIPRGEPWNEVLFLVTEGATNNQNNAILCWNTQIDGWTIWPPSNTGTKMLFATGTNFVDSSGIPRTIMGDYSGNVYDCFGHNLADTTFTDDGATIRTEFSTGFLDFGYKGVKGLRQIILDLEAPDTKTFSILIEAMGKSPIFSGTFKAGAGGGILDVDFMLDESVLSVGSVTQAQMPLKSAGRYFSIELTETDTDSAHVISALTLPWVVKGMRMV